MRGAPRASIEDVIQETYLRLLRLLPASSVKNLEAYIRQVATNVVKDFAKRDSRERRHISFDSYEVDKLSDDSAAGWVDPAESAVETEEELARITEHLPPHLRATLLLRKRDGLSYDEIATQLGKSPHTIRKYYFAALALCVVRANRR
jgi:RNA polymerase sigma-70 factor (ECF subfamily)